MCTVCCYLLVVCYVPVAVCWYVDIGVACCFALHCCLMFVILCCIVCVGCCVPVVVCCV